MKPTIKILTGLSLFLLLANTGYSQIFAFGFKAGMTTGSAKFNDIDQRFVDGINSKNVVGYEGGVMMRLKLGPVYVRPEALYNFTSGDVGYTRTSSSSPNGSESTNFKIHRLQVPVLFGFNIVGPLLAIEAGPMYTYTMSATSDYGGTAVGFNRNGLGYRAGLASKIGPLQLNLSYQGVTTNSGPGYARFSQPSALVFGIGFLFGAGPTD